MPTCDTRYFGTREYSDDSLIQMTEGPFGFESETEFVLLQAPDQYPLVYLQSVRTPELCFLALPVLAIDREYTLLLGPEDAARLATPELPRIGADVLCLVLITTGEDGPTANLLAPIVVNLHGRQALQCINTAAGYSHQQPLCTESEGVAA